MGVALACVGAPAPSWAGPDCEGADRPAQAPLAGPEDRPSRAPLADCAERGDEVPGPAVTLHVGGAGTATFEGRSNNAYWGGALAGSFALVPGRAPEERRDVAYDARLGEDGRMDVYFPDGDAPRNPAVLFIHGGGWTGGDKDHFRNAARRLARSGYVVASTNYRLVPRGTFPRNIQDCLCSLAYLRAHASEHRIDPDRIVVMGYSAGAHLAGLVGLASSNPEVAPDCAEARGAPIAPPAGVIAACGPLDMRTFWRDAKDKADIERIFGGSPATLPHAYALGSPRWHVRAGAPPFLVLGDAFDFGGIEETRDALAAAGTDVQLLKIAGSLHVLEQHADPGAYEVGMATETPEAWIAIDDFLDRTIGSARAGAAR